MIRRLALTVNGYLWARWWLLPIPPDRPGAGEFGATPDWSPREVVAALEPADWDDAARAEREEARFWAGWNTAVDHVEDDLRDGLDRVEAMVRAALTDTNPDEATAIDTALVGVA